MNAVLSFVMGIAVWLLIAVGYVEVCIQLLKWQERRAYRKREEAQQGVKPS